MPNSTMTNANIDSAVVSADGQELVLKYKDGEKKFIVPKSVEVVMFAPAAVADLKLGEKVFVVAGKNRLMAASKRRASLSAATGSIRPCEVVKARPLNRPHHWPGGASGTLEWHGNCSLVAACDPQTGPQRE
jgi:hypothetical protein